MIYLSVWKSPSCRCCPNNSPRSTAVENRKKIEKVDTNKIEQSQGDFNWKSTLLKAAAVGLVIAGAAYLGYRQGFSDGSEGMFDALKAHGMGVAGHIFNATEASRAFYIQEAAKNNTWINLDATALYERVGSYWSEVNVTALYEKSIWYVQNTKAEVFSKIATLLTKNATL